MFIDRLQTHSMLEYWSIDVCECSGETGFTIYKNQIARQSKRQRLDSILQYRNNKEKENSKPTAASTVRMEYCKSLVECGVQNC